MKLNKIQEKDMKKLLKTLKSVSSNVTLFFIEKHVNKPTDFFPYNDDRLPYNSRQYMPKFL